MEALTPEQVRTLAAETKGPIVLGLVISFTILSFTFVALRIVTRFWIIKNGGWEDYTIVLAMAFNIGMAACQIVQVNYGSGQHARFLELPQVIGILKYLYWSIFAYCITLSLTKMSILLQYRRIFGSSGPIRYVIFISMFIVIGFGTLCVISGLWTCVPAQAFWDLSPRATASCVDENKLWFANAGINIVTDLIIATIPLPVISSLKMPIRQKIALMIILGIGWFVCVVSMLRLNALIILSKETDTTFYSSDTAYWSTIEINVAIICACLPTLKPIFAMIFPRYLGPSNYGASSNAKGGSAFIELGDSQAKTSKYRGGTSWNAGEDGLKTVVGYDVEATTGTNGDGDKWKDNGNKKGIQVKKSIEHTIWVEDEDF